MPGDIRLLFLLEMIYRLRRRWLMVVGKYAVHEKVIVCIVGRTYFILLFPLANNTGHALIANDEKSSHKSSFNKSKYFPSFAWSLAIFPVCVLRSDNPLFSLLRLISSVRAAARRWTDDKLLVGRGSDSQECWKSDWCSVEFRILILVNFPYLLGFVWFKGAPKGNGKFHRLFLLVNWRQQPKILISHGNRRMFRIRRILCCMKAASWVLYFVQLR